MFAADLLSEVREGDGAGGGDEVEGLVVDEGLEDAHLDDGVEVAHGGA